MKETVTGRRFCGNCGSHNAYSYPDQVFCGHRFAESLDPIVQTLWCCESWNPTSQQCHCIREAMKNKYNKSRVLSPVRR